MAGADAVFVSPVFATASHPDRRALGSTRFATLTGDGAAIYALGGIETKTIRRLAAHRLVGIGLIGGWVRS
jgi:thiamine-phosphate pyrophosphorylase